MGDVTVQGLSELQAAIAEVSVGLPQMTGAALEEAGLIVAARARSLAPRRTGRLAGGIKPGPVEYEGATVQVRVTFDAPYGRFQETGTRYMHAHKFLAPAVEQAGTAALAAIERDLFRALDAAWG